MKSIDLVKLTVIVFIWIKRLFDRYHKMKYQRPLCDHWYGRNEPTISYIALVQIKTRRFIDNKFGIFTYFLSLIKKLTTVYKNKNIFNMSNMWSFPANISRWILGVIEGAVQGWKFRIVEQIIRIVSSTQLIVHLILIRIDLGLFTMYKKLIFSLPIKVVLVYTYRWCRHDYFAFKETLKYFLLFSFYRQF